MILRAILQANLPRFDGADLLKLVHLLNGFRMVNSTGPLKAWDVHRAEAQIVSVINSDVGMTVKVKGNVLQGAEAVIEVNSSFLYHGRFTDYDNTFEIIDKPEYIVSLMDAATVGVLQPKEWFDWWNDAQPLLPGTHLVFHVQSELVYKDKSMFSSIVVTGRVYVHNQLKTLVPVATLEYSNGVSVGNPVIAYLQHHGQVQGKPALFETPYSLTTTSAPSTFITPAMNEPYSKVSGDFNPIHINPYFSDYTSLLGTITHSMWSSAATCKYVETIVAQGKPSRVLSSVTKCTFPDAIH
jgi:fatty acid synthase subunit alpha, fungi type/fatty acid synthase subunit beta, fungi type